MAAGAILTHQIRGYRVCVIYSNLLEGIEWLKYLDHSEKSGKTNIVSVEAAKKLLQEGISLALCAQYCGFVDQSHFHRFFKRYTALTPKEYQVNFIQ